MELIAATACILVVAGFLADSVKGAIERALLTSCASNLRLTSGAFRMYREDYHMLPEFHPPQGLGDLDNWADLYAHADPWGEYFSLLTVQPGGIRLGNMTADPRVPRLLAEYTGGNGHLAVCCPGRGRSEFWKDVGPYYYNTNNPFFFGTEKMWRPLARFDRRQPLAACQNPQFMLLHYDRTWRHGIRRGPEGTNNHLRQDGAVRELLNPQDWLAE